MMHTAIAGYIIIVINILFSYKGFNDKIFYDKYKFKVDRILINKEYYRIISSSFLHIDWQHLFFNMLSLYFFFELVEMELGMLQFLILYFVSMIGGDLLALFIHKNHGDYSAVGASGAVCGIIFASIALFPGIEITLFLILSIPAWLYGILYVAYAIYGIKSKHENIGHEAHLGGALIGMLTAIAIHPSSLKENYFTILVISVPCIVFIYLIVTRPHFLLIDNYFFTSKTKYYSIDHKYNEQKKNKQDELDKLLDKIGKNGMTSLTRKEKQRLEEFSGKR